MVRSRDQWLGVGITKSLCVYVFMLCNVIMLSYVMLSYVMLSCVMLCPVISCHVM